MKDKSIYPPVFLQRMKDLLKGEYGAFMESLDTPSPTSVRINPFKPTTKFDNEEPVPWCTNGKYLIERPSFTFDPLFHAGTYYVQEASSMLIEQAWKQVNPNNHTVKVLDMCAAPGGKSTHLLSLMNKDSLLVTNEIIPNRNKILQQNIIKWGSANCIVTQNKPEDFAVHTNYFDIILVDAPCSGEGLFRKDKEAIDEWSEKNVANCTIRQKDILQQAIACLKPGGHLIYSTCTFEPLENDDNIEWMQKMGVETQYLASPDVLQGITKTKYGYQCYPHKIKGEGFYLAVLKKEGLSEPAASTIKFTTTSPLFAQYLTEPGNYTEMTKGDGLLFAIPKNIKRDADVLGRNLYIRQAGIFMGSSKGKDFLPSADLALSNHIRNDIPKVELSEEQAIAYLRCETPKIDTELRGWALATYQHISLGWMKLMDQRWNNYYPKEWRILKR